MILLWISSGILMGTFGLAWAHELVHRYTLFNISVVWKYHRDHHTKADTEATRRNAHCMPIYVILSFSRYLNITRWSLVDWLFLGIMILVPQLALCYIISILVAESIGYLQHNTQGYPVDFVNKFDNYVGFDCGHHSKHHNRITKYRVGTEVFCGVACAWLWFFICIALWPTLLISRKKPNLPGVYGFGFWQNVSNYKAAEGCSLLNVLYRMPSVFDNPKLLTQYVSCIFDNSISQNYNVVRYRGNIKTLTQSHDISLVRNIYEENSKVPNDKSIYIYKETIINGHHRHAAGCAGLRYLEITV